MVTFTTWRVKLVVWVTFTAAASMPVTVTVYIPGEVEDVVIVRVELGVPGTVIEVGLNEQLAPAGNPEQDRAIVPA
jgi:hypothetical protein